MKIYLFLAFLLTVASAFAADAMKFVSPNKLSTLVLDKSGRRDIIELQSGKRVHRLFYQDLDPFLNPKSRKASNASLNKVGQIAFYVYQRSLDLYVRSRNQKSVANINAAFGSLLPDRARLTCPRLVTGPGESGAIYLGAARSETRVLSRAEPSVGTNGHWSPVTTTLQ